MSRRVYVGVMTEVPSGTVTKNLSVANLNDFFTVSNGSTTWTLSDSTTGKIGLVPGNIGVPNSTASITLTAKQDLTNVVISGQYYTESNYDKINLTVAGTKKITDGSGNSSLSNRYTGSLLAEKSIILKYSKDSSTDASNEANTKFYIACDSIQAPSGETELKSVARRVKKIYVGINGIARQVKRAYAGVANLARQFFGGYDAIQQVSNPTQFVKSSYDDAVDSASLNGVSAITLPGKYAIFAGSYTSGFVSGTYTYYASKYVYAVDKNLVVTEAANLAKYSAWINPASLDTYTVFGGGYSSTSITNSSNNPSRASSDVCAYDANLTRHDLDALSYFGSDSAAYNKLSAGNGKYAIYPRWSVFTSADSTNYIDTYGENLIKTQLTFTGIGDRIGTIGACRFGNYAVFFGSVNEDGFSATSTATSCAYNQTLTKLPMPNLSKRRYGIANYLASAACVSTPNYVAVAGGTSESSATSSLTSIDIYDKNLINVSHLSLSQSRRWFSGTNIDNYMVFFGGYGDKSTSSTNTSLQTVDIFDENLIRTTDDMGHVLYYTAAASIGDYGVAVGYGSSTNTAIFKGV